MTAKDLSERLARQAEDVARHLLPNGTRIGDEWCVGSTGGEKGKSLKVSLRGDKTGRWADFAADGHGDLIDLWMAVRGLSLAHAIREAREFLGIRAPKFHGSRPRTYQKPPAPRRAGFAGDDPVLEWLTHERRLTRETLAAYRVTSEGRKVILPFYRDGELTMVKYRAIDPLPNGKKDTRPTGKDQEPCLFGWQAIPPNAREVAICEGEIDAMSLFQYSYPALSVPFGAGDGDTNAWIENDWERLEGIDRIYVVMDGDAAGERAAADIVERLGRHRCFVVKLPRNDANECLQVGIGKEGINGCFRDAKTLDPDELRSAGLYVDKVIREFFPPDGEVKGLASPWSKVGDRLRFRRGEVTVLAGFNGQGKSEGAGHLSLGFMRQGAKVCVASLEFRPRRWLARLTRQAAAIESPSEPFIRAIHQWYAGRLWVFDVVGTARTERLLSVFAYARGRYGIDVFVIDNLSKCGIDEDDYKRQKAFVDKLTDFAKEHDCHVILVAHARKRDSEMVTPGKMDVKGTGAITDMVDTVLSWWRNKPKEEKARNGEDAGDKPDAIVTCLKQRNGDDEPKILLWFDRGSHQFLERSDARPWRYVDFSQEPQSATFPS